MILQLDVERMIESKLTASQYMLLELLRLRKDKLIRKYIDLDPNTIKDIKVLKSLGYILKMDKTGYLINQKQCNKILDIDDNMFWEVFGLYPIRVYNGSTTRILRSASPDSKEAKECLKKYRSKVKTESKHRKVVKCLEFELNIRKKEKNLGYMQKLVTWLNQNSWENYEAMVDEVGSLTVGNTEEYGGGLI